MDVRHTIEDEAFMERALELAMRGRGSVSPNPLVGCVIVHEGRIIGEGWHRKYGEGHAEVNAINAVENKALLKESVVYVTLEPCSHFGKTPPCADLLVQHQVKKVIVANVDSNPLVAGEGVKKLNAAGIETVVGVLEKKGRELNARFFAYMEKKRPYIVLKWAETADGFMARENYDSKWISNEYSRQLTHKWRTEEDAILVGTQTAMRDNPRLNVRDWTGRNPIRIVIDRHLKLPGSLHLFEGSQQTFCYNLSKNETRGNTSFIKTGEENFIDHLLKDLYQRKIQSVFVEGGAQTLNAFLDVGVWDEARIFVSPQKFEKGIKSPVLNASLIEEHRLQSDVLKIFRPGST